MHIFKMFFNNTSCKDYAEAVKTEKEWYYYREFYNIYFAYSKDYTTNAGLLLSGYQL